MRGGLLPVAAALAVSLAPSGALAQEAGRSPEELVQYWSDLYDAAFREYQDALLEFQPLDSIWNALDEERKQLIESNGNPADIRRITGEMQSRSNARQRATGRRDRAKAQWENVADSFMDALDNYLTILANAFGATAGAEQDELTNQYNRWLESLEQVERDLGPNLSLELGPLPDVVARDDDTPQDLERKARSLEDRARRDSAAVAGVEERIAALERRLARDRSTEGFSARIRRFGDMTIPLVPITEGGPEIVGDSTAADLTQTPEQRIELLETLRDRMVARVEQLLARARELREEAARRRR